jgi:hypothetical protein
MSGLARILETSIAFDRLRELLQSPLDTETRARIEIELERRIPLDDAAALNSVHPSTFKRNYGHLVEKFGPRLDLVKLRHALTLPPPETKSKTTRRHEPGKGAAGVA